MEGANNPVTDGDMISHRVMYYGLLKGFPGLNVISEEDDPQAIDMNEVQIPLKSDSSVDAIISAGDDVLVVVLFRHGWVDVLLDVDLVDEARMHCIEEDVYDIILDTVY